jgi:hypothetical protein
MDLRALIRKSRDDHPQGPRPKHSLLRLQEIENLQGHTSVHSSLAGVAQNGEKSKEAVQSCEENPRPCFYIKYLKARMQDSEFDSTCQRDGNSEPRKEKNSDERRGKFI